ncbi:SET domain-containing protein [Singulisphaera rosea]
MLEPSVTIRDSPVHGKGVFADRDIPAGAAILEYAGERISREEAERRESGNAEGGVTYILCFDESTFIDGAVGGNAARYLNHSCEPNCTIRREGGRATIVASMPILAGHELFFDYAFDPDDTPVPCHCAASGCRGVLNELPRTDH